ncbi:MAG: ABC transporter ATP-binding protein [Anaerolineales bacterium]|jgi:ATP-binding cassette subfamily B protein/subfamily B ATP-binding cassette protein MsbA
MATTIIPPAYVTEYEEQYSQGVNPKNARRLGAFVRPYTARLILAAFLMLCASAASVAGPYLIGYAIDNGLSARNPLVLRDTILAYLGMAVITWACTYYRVNTMTSVAVGIVYDLRKSLFDHLQKLSLGFYSRYSVGRVITRVINDVETLRDFLTWAALAITRDIFTVALIIFIMLEMDVRLALLTFSVLPVMVLITVLLQRASRTAYRKVRAAISWVNSVLAENVNGVRVVHAFSRHQQNYDHFRDYVNRYYLELALTTARIASLFSPSVDLLGAIATGLVVWLGGTAVLGNKITAGVLVAFILYINNFFDPIRDLSRRYDAMQSTLVGWERLMGLLDTPVDIQDAPEAVALPVLSGEVDFDHVSFHYSDDPAPVLEHIDLHIGPGETVALVGETGAGKTTLVKLLSRFYDPTEGTIRVDGYDLRRVTQASLRSQMGVVLQDPFLFNGTVAENIRFGRLEASQAEIQAAARAVGAHNFIVRLPKGYETSVEEGGVLLSAGQRQLLSFARALLADPRILILDEATSSVDTQTEQLIQKALARLLKGRTSLVIAHRLSTITSADRIVVIHDGRIIEQGSHADLLSMRGMYYQLYQIGFQDEQSL